MLETVKIRIIGDKTGRDKLLKILDKKKVKYDHIQDCPDDNGMFDVQFDILNSRFCKIRSKLMAFGSLKFVKG